MTEENGRSPWSWVAWGCGGCLALSGLVIAVLSVGGYMAYRTFQREMRDPTARTEKAKRLLGTDSLPEGYLAVVTLSVPFLFDTVILADEPLDEDGELAESTERLFIYVDAIRGDRNWQRYTSGEADPSEILQGQGIRLRGREEIGGGELKLDGCRIDHVSHRGNLIVQHRAFDGITTFLLIRCEGDTKLRVGVWINPDPLAETPVAEADFAGTNADPAEIRSFVSLFDFCSG